MALTTVEVSAIRHRYLFWQAHQFFCALWQRVLRHVHLHCQQGVIRIDAGQVDDGLFAETFFGALEGAVRYPLTLVQLG